MSEVFRATEVLQAGGLSRGQLRWNYRKVFPGIYLPATQTPTLRHRIAGAWLWSGCNAVVAGRAAAALHGARWIGDATPVEMIWQCSRSPGGIVTRNERITDDEIVDVDGISVTSPERTALDLARHLPRGSAVHHLDALARATGVTAGDALAVAALLPRARGLRRAPVALGLMDAGAESPRETRLRLLLIDAGLPRPRTQVRITDGVNQAFLDLGYDDVMIGLDYDGRHHSTERDQYVHDIGRAELIERAGWIDIHVVAEHSRRYILHRVSEAFARRGHPVRLLLWS